MENFKQEKAKVMAEANTQYNAHVEETIKGMVKSRNIMVDAFGELLDKFEKQESIDIFEMSADNNILYAYLTDSNRKSFTYIEFALLQIKPVGTDPEMSVTVYKDENVVYRFYMHLLRDFKTNWKFYNFEMDCALKKRP